MKLNVLILKLAFCLAACLMACELSAQTFTVEKRIYLVDVSKSMKASVFNEAKANLEEALDDIIDPRTEVVIIPFADRLASEKDVISGTIADKDTLKLQIEALKVRSGGTNLADAWENGMEYLDATKLNYLFLITAGTQNAGPDKETLYDRLRAWDTISEGKPYYAFCVMLDDMSIDPEIQMIAEETPNMWAIESMNVNPVLFTTPSVQHHNVFEDKTVGVAFTSNNTSASLDDLDLQFVVDNNPYYTITETVHSKQDPKVLEFKVLELVDRLNIPLDVNLKVRVKHDEEQHPGVFFIPEVLDLKIYNRGVRRMTMKDENGSTASIDFGKGVYREPFRGLLSSHPKWLVSTLDWPLIKSLRPDSLALARTVEIGFNEDAVRCEATATLQFVDEDYDKLKGVKVYCDGVRVGDEGYLVKATAIPQKIKVTFQIDPVRKGGSHKGYLLVSGVDVDEANEVKLYSDGLHNVLDWNYTYRRGVALLLWLTWLLLIVVIPVLLIVTAVLLFKRRAFLKGHPFLSKKGGLVHEPHSPLGKFFQDKVERVVLLNNVKADIEVLKAEDQPCSQKADALRNLHGHVVQLKESNSKLYKEEILILLKGNLKKALRKYHVLVWKTTPYEGIGGHWEGVSDGVKFVLNPLNPLYKACSEAGMTECVYGISGEPSFDQATENGTVVNCADLYDADYDLKKDKKQVLEGAFGNTFLGKAEECIANKKQQELLTMWKTRHPNLTFDLYKAYTEWKILKNLVPHEDANCKTFRLVYRPVHEAFGHAAGIERMRLVKSYFK